MSREVPDPTSPIRHLKCILRQQYALNPINNPWPRLFTNGVVNHSRLDLQRDLIGYRLKFVFSIDVITKIRHGEKPRPICDIIPPCTRLKPGHCNCLR